jgi:hypothetical protein
MDDPADWKLREPHRDSFDVGKDEYGQLEDLAYNVRKAAIVALRKAMRSKYGAFR